MWHFRLVDVDKLPDPTLESTHQYRSCACYVFLTAKFLACGTWLTYSEVWDVVRCACIARTADRYLQLFWGSSCIKRQRGNSGRKNEHREISHITVSCLTVIARFFDWILLNGSSNKEWRLSLRSTEVNRTARAQKNHRWFGQTRSSATEGIYGVTGHYSCIKRGAWIIWCEARSNKTDARNIGDRWEWSDPSRQRDRRHTRTYGMDVYVREGQLKGQCAVGLDRAQH